ncbi:hypothetical protein JW756_05175 [Candidatus Woesearchaeota archaeon]|nr:hypothetical protein [Candidatus Woesearchaeota archaeon]
MTISFHYTAKNKGLRNDLEVRIAMLKDYYNILGEGVLEVSAGASLHQVEIVPTARAHVDEVRLDRYIENPKALFMRSSKDSVLIEVGEIRYYIQYSHTTK